MKGQYTGFYRYDSERIQEKLAREKTLFEIDITETNGKEFAGIVKEEAIGQPGTGTITGVLNGDKISFIKQMSMAASIAADGQNKVYNTRHPKIYYEGTYMDGVFKGTWKIKFGFIFVGLLPIPIPATSGTWEMKQYKHS